MAVAVTDADFDTAVLKSDKPVLVDFWAEWCQPCKQLSPLVEELAKTHGDKVTIAKLDIDSNPAATQRYGIRGIPTLMLFKGGEVAAMKVGLLSKTQLTSWVEQNI